LWCDVHLAGAHELSPNLLHPPITNPKASYDDFIAHCSKYTQPSSQFQHFMQIVCMKYKNIDDYLHK